MYVVLYFHIFIFLFLSHATPPSNVSRAAGHLATQGSKHRTCLSALPEE